jgi:peptidoglycan/LPS O-acetylase OafA/YrhL
MAALKPQRVSVVAGSLTFYLVTTALLTVRRRGAGQRWIDLGAMLVALAVGIASLRLGFEALDNASGRIEGLPAASAFVLGAVALLAALGDARMLLARGIQGAERIARHLWRMCFALAIAAASLFLTRVGPEPLREGALPAIPVLLVLLVMLYWLARVSFPGRSFRLGRPFQADASSGFGLIQAPERDRQGHQGEIASHAAL